MRHFTKISELCSDCHWISLARERFDPFIYFLHDTSRVYFKLWFAGIARAITELYSNAEVSAVTAVSSLW